MKNSEDFHYAIFYSIWDDVWIAVYDKFTSSKNASWLSRFWKFFKIDNMRANIAVHLYSSFWIFLCDASCFSIQVKNGMPQPFNAHGNPTWHQWRPFLRL